MNTLKAIIIVTILAWAIPASAQYTTASLTASGLTCSMCSKSIYKALMKVPSVNAVDANVEKSRFDISFKQDSQVSFDELKKAVQDAGFSVASLSVTATFNNVVVYNDAIADVGGNTLHFVNVSRQTLNGDKTITIVDKNYLPAKEYKKYEAHKGANTTKRIYHVTM